MDRHLRTYVWFVCFFCCCLLPRSKLFEREVLFYSCESVFLFVCLSFCDQDNSISSWPIFMKFGSKLGYHKRKVKFDIYKIRPDRAQTSSKRNDQNTISQKVGRPVLMKFGRKLGYHKRKVNFDIDKNRPDRAQTSHNIWKS